MAVDEGVDEAAPVVGLRRVWRRGVGGGGRGVSSCSGRLDEGATKRICGRGLVSWQSGPGRVENGIGEVLPLEHCVDFPLKRKG